MPTEDLLTDETYLQLNQDASDLYGLIHRRYIETTKGLGKIYQKYLLAIFGHCPRVFCDKQKLLPIGFDDKLRHSRVKNYCPKCEEVYVPKSSKHNDLDGSYFGSALPHIFMSSLKEAIILPPKVYFYEPSLFGFKLFGSRGSKYFNPIKGAETTREDREDVSLGIARVS